MSIFNVSMGRLLGRYLIPDYDLFVCQRSKLCVDIPVEALTRRTGFFVREVMGATAITGDKVRLLCPCCYFFFRIFFSVFYCQVA